MAILHRNVGLGLVPELPQRVLTGVMPSGALGAGLPLRLQDRGVTSMQLQPVRGADRRLQPVRAETWAGPRKAAGVGLPKTCMPRMQKMESKIIL